MKREFQDVRHFSYWLPKASHLVSTTVRCRTVTPSSKTPLLANFLSCAARSAHMRMIYNYFRMRCPSVPATPGHRRSGRQVRSTARLSVLRMERCACPNYPQERPRRQSKATAQSATQIPSPDRFSTTFPACSGLIKRLRMLRRPPIVQCARSSSISPESAHGPAMPSRLSSARSSSATRCGMSGCAPDDKGAAR